MPQNIHVIVLAAGDGSRFKQAGGVLDKLQAPLAGMTVRTHVLAAVHASGLPHHIVEREHLSHIKNPGMADSIACGVAATRGALGWLILPADLPLIQAATLQQVATQLKNISSPNINSCCVVRPVYQGQQGHPVGFSNACLNDLLNITGDQGAKSVVERHQAIYLPVNDPGCVMDVDTPALLALAEQFMAAKNLAIQTDSK